MNTPNKSDVTELSFKNSQFEGLGNALVLGCLVIDFEFVADYAGRASIVTHEWGQDPKMSERVEGEYLAIIEELISNDI
jgi:hypothetical protein